MRPLLARLLVNRGWHDPAVAAAVLDASLARGLRSPLLFSEMARAAERLLGAVRHGERIAIYGDYDVDGISASTELLLFLRELGCEPLVHIPHRMRDGYGVHVGALRSLRESGVGLVVTADCGAAAHEEIVEASRLGLEVIVCDHHQNPATRPPAFAVLNPVVAGAGFPFAGLCAAGVMFYLLLGTRMLLRETGGPIPDLRRYLDLAALGTVADLVPLVEENRVIVKYGLREMARNPRPGVRALLELGGVSEATVDTIGFRLGPRLNASGRLADATRAVELLASSEGPMARRLAAELDAHNAQRRGIEDATVEEAEQMIAALPDASRRRSFVLASEGWHPGVVGIVASRLVERYSDWSYCWQSRASWLAGPREESVRAFVRAAARGRRLARALRRSPHGCRTDDSFGAHRRVHRALRGGHRGDDDRRFFVPELRIDARVELDALSPETLQDVEKLEPFGQGTPGPSFSRNGSRYCRVASLANAT